VQATAVIADEHPELVGGDRCGHVQSTSLVAPIGVNDRVGERF